VNGSEELLERHTNTQLNLKVKKALIFGFIGLLAPALSAAESGPQDKIVSAAKQLGDKPNYSWTTVFKEGDSGPFPGISGKLSKGGPMCLISMMGTTPSEVYLNGRKGTAKGPGGWRTFDEIAKPGGFAAALVGYLRNYKPPSVECGALSRELQNVKEQEGILSGELKGDVAAKEYMEFFIPGYAGQDPPKIADPKGSVKFWIEKGMLTKYEIDVQCKVTRGDQESEFHRTTTVEIKDVGTTKLEVPDEAKQKLL
jgi:hypothetical protein